MYGKRGKKKVASWGHQVSKITIRCHFHINSLCQKISLSCHVTTNISSWTLLTAIGTLTGTVFYVRMTISLISTGWWRVCDAVGLFLAHGTMDSIKYQDISNQNLAASAMAISAPWHKPHRKLSRWAKEESAQEVLSRTLDETRD